MLLVLALAAPVLADLESDAEAAVQAYDRALATEDPGERLAGFRNATLVRVNPREADIPPDVRDGLSIESGALEAIEGLVDA